jgi:hypothetical protein
MITEDAFAHHVWATLRLVDTCLALSPEQLGTAVPGTYGSILETVRHLVGADSSYLFVTSGERTPLIDEDHLGLPELRAAMEGHGAAWSSLLARDLDPTPSRGHEDTGTQDILGINWQACTTDGSSGRSHRPHSLGLNRRTSMSWPSASGRPRARSRPSDEPGTGRLRPDRPEDPVRHRRHGLRRTAGARGTVDHGRRRQGAVGGAFSSPSGARTTDGPGGPKSLTGAERDPHPGSAPVPARSGPCDQYGLILVRRDRHRRAVGFPATSWRRCSRAARRSRP